jgi:hypothetical protein
VTERAHGADTFGVGVHAPLSESGRERGILVVAKYDQEMVEHIARKLGQPGPGRSGFVQPGPDDFARFGIIPYEVHESEESNVIASAGWDRLLTLGIGGGGTAYASASARIGVGTATATANSGQTDLQAATGTANRNWQMVTGAGTVGTGTGARRLSFVATFGTGEANFAWQEWGIDQGTTSGNGAVVGALLNRAVSAQGTKASGQTWTATAQLDFT